jgi:hypothetical protein
VFKFFVNYSQQTFSSLQDERNPFPSWVMNPQCCGSKRWAYRVRRNGIIVEVTRFSIRGDILPQKGVFPFDGRD